MSKTLALIVIALAVLFGAVALLKSRAVSDEPDEGGEAAYTEAERAKVQRFWAAYRKATDLRLAGRLDEAAAAYTEALKLNQNHEDALYYLGNIQIERGRVADGKAALERLVQVNPNSARGHARLGDIRFCLGVDSLYDPVAAEAAYRRAHTINKEETGPLLRLGQVALMVGDLERARTYFDDVLRTHETSVTAAFLGGYAAWKMGDAARSDTLFARALADPRAPAGPVPGEGDTKAGSAHTAASGGCPLFDPYIDSLLRPPASEAPDRYRALERELIHP